MTGGAVYGNGGTGIGITIFINSVTSLIGGAVNQLDGIPTVGIDAGVKVELRHTSGADLAFLLINSTGAEVVPWVIRPDDYASSTNEKVWSLMSVSKDGLICAWQEEDATKFHRLFVNLSGGAAMLKPETTPFTINS